MEKWLSARAAAISGGIVAAIVIIVVLALTQAGCHRVTSVEPGAPGAAAV